MEVLAATVFVLMYAVIVSEKIHRTVAAMLGAVIMMLAGIMSIDTALHHVDFNTLGLLVGMMLLVGVTSHTGLFDFVAIWAAQKANAEPKKLLTYLAVITAVFSAFLDNVTTVLLMVPVTFSITQKLHLKPMPFLLTQILASNIGGTATLIGDPPNIMIGSGAGLTFADFICYDGPVCVIILAVFIVIFYFLYGRKLTSTPEARDAIMVLDESEVIRDKGLMHKSIVMIVVVIVAFMLHGQLQLESSMIALAAATVMLLIGGQDIEEMILGVEWTTIGFFAGLFVVVGGMVQTGVIDMLAQALIDVTGGDPVATMLVILCASAVISSILDNIPFTATMIPIILYMGSQGIDVWPLWWALSLGACLGGNGTLIGASANVVLSGISTREGYPITFMSFLKVGMPMMLLSIAITAVYLMIRFVWIPF